MAVRNQHKVGDHLLLDDESGLVIYKSEAVKRWDGLWVRRDQFETRQPQEFVYARDDPKALRHVRPEPVCPVPQNTVSGYIGETDVQTKPSPAGHIFAQTGIAGPGRRGMIIEGQNANTRFRVA